MQIWRTTQSAPRTSLMKARLVRPGCFVLTMPPQKNLASSSISFVLFRYDLLYFWTPREIRWPIFGNTTNNSWNTTQYFWNTNQFCETQHKIVETQHKIAETQHKITETQHKIIETQHKVVETTQNYRNAIQNYRNTTQSCRNTTQNYRNTTQNYRNNTKYWRNTRISLGTRAWKRGGCPVWRWRWLWFAEPVFSRERFTTVTAYRGFVSKSQLLETLFTPN